MWCYRPPAHRADAPAEPTDVAEFDWPLGAAGAKPISEYPVIRPGGPPVALISQAVARAHWPSGAALGSRIRFDKTWFTIVGTVGDVQQYPPERGARGGTIYALNEQLPQETQGNDIGRLIVLVTRTADEPAPVIAAVRRVVAEMDKDQPVADVSTMEQLVWRTLAARRLNTLLVSVFAGLAIVLAAIGTFGVTSYAVARRTKEIGIRMAVGATPRSVLVMVARETLLLAVIGAYPSDQPIFPICGGDV